MVSLIFPNCSCGGLRGSSRVRTTPFGTACCEDVRRFVGPPQTCWPTGFVSVYAAPKNGVLHHRSWYRKRLLSIHYTKESRTSYQVLRASTIEYRQTASAASRRQSQWEPPFRAGTAPSRPKGSHTIAMPHSEV